MKGAQGRQSVTLSLSRSFLWLVPPNSLACPMFRREQGYSVWGHSLGPLPQQPVSICTFGLINILNL